MVEEITLETLRAMAERAGLKLAEEELQRLLPGVNRSRKQVAELRQIIGVADEPPGTFDASLTVRK